MSFLVVIDFWSPLYVCTLNVENLCFRCYGRALKLMPEASSLWCDLGLNYYHQSKHLLSQHTENDIHPLLEKALQVFYLT